MAKNKEKEPKINKEAEPKIDSEFEPESSDYGQIFAAWQFLEYEKPDRTKKWYLWFSLIFILLIIMSSFNMDFTIFRYAGKNFGLSFYQNPLFVVLIVLFIIIYFYTERLGAPKISFAITEDGLVIQNKLVEYKELENFYIIYYPPGIKNLYFQRKNHFKPPITIPLEDQNPVRIRETLLNFLAEDLDKEEEPVSDGISRALKL